MAALGDEKIGGLDVAVDDAVGVRRIECVRRLNRKIEQRIEVDLLIRDEVLQRLAVEVLHGDERLAIGFANVVDGADTRMIQRGRRLRLALKSRQCLLVFRHGLRQELQCDETAQPRVLGFIDDTHPATAEFLDDAVMRIHVIDARIRGRHVSAS